MTELEIQREAVAFEEKIALAELEATKAEERVRELRYQKARFITSVAVMRVREESQKMEKGKV